MQTKSNSYVVTPLSAAARPDSSRRESPDEIRRILQNLKAAGTVSGGKTGAVPIVKNGVTATNLGGIRTVWMHVSPELAQLWMGNNFVNRKMVDDVVHTYAREMSTANWIPTHQGVAFNDKDELIDGQHRLQAIILSGVTVLMMVTFGLPSNILGKEMTTMDAVDRGRTRSVADQLTIQHGLKNSSIIASICASLGSICYGERTRRLSVGQTLEIYRAFETPISWVIIHRSKQHGLRTAGVLAAFAFALATEEAIFGGMAPIGLMYESLMNGENLKDRLPMKHLRNFLTSDEAKLLTRGTDRGVAELVLQAIYLEGTGRRIAKLEMSLDGSNHFRSLQKQRVEKIAGIFRLPKAESKK
jgi:hypothetical protein